MKMFRSIYLLFFLLLTVNASFRLQIKAGQNKSQSTVRLTGGDQHPIKDAERETWGMTDDKLFEGMTKAFGARPSRVFLCGPTYGVNAPKDDLYKAFGWQPVKTIYNAVDGYVYSMSSRPVVVARQVYTNRRNTTAKHKCTLSQSIETSSENTWSQHHSVGVGIEVKVGFKLAETTTKLEYTYEWGKDYTETKTETVQTSAEVESDVPPGGTITASLSANRGRMTVRCTYNTSMTGHVAANYANGYKNHYFYHENFNYILYEAGLPRTYITTSDLVMEFFSEIEIETY